MVSRMTFGRLTATGGAVLAVLAVVLSATAGTAGAATYAPTTFTSQEIGPIKTAHGWTMFLNESDCGQKESLLDVYYTRDLGKHEVVAHDYLGGASTCTLSSTDPAGGTLTAHWGKLLDISLQFVDPGAVKQDPAPKGCTGVGPTVVDEVASGTITARFHPAVLGAVSAHSARTFANEYSVTAVENESCKNVGFTGLDIGFGKGLLPDRSVVAAASGHQREIDIDDENGDRPAKGIFGDTSFLLTGPSKLFTWSHNLMHAAVKVKSKEVTGSFRFTGLAMCPGSPDARNGTLAGTLSIDDPILGKVRLNGTRATNAGLSGPKGNPGICNGIGKIEVKVVNSCAKKLDGCKASFLRNKVTVVDESYSGTEKISSETVNFGDGSKPVKIRLDGYVKHTYKRPGTYRVTLTLKGSKGVHAAHTTVHIES